MTLAKIRNSKRQKQLSHSRKKSVKKSVQRDDESRFTGNELIELSSINKISLVYVSSCSNTGSIRDDLYWTSRKNSLELIELSSINKVSLV
jgi:hypothetical protein